MMLFLTGSTASIEAPPDAMCTADARPSARVAHLRGETCCYDYCAASGERCVAACFANEDTKCTCADTEHPLKGTFGGANPGGWKARLCSETEDERLCICAPQNLSSAHSESVAVSSSTSMAEAEKEATSFFSKLDAANEPLRRPADPYIQHALEAATDPLCAQVKKHELEPYS